MPARFTRTDCPGSNIAMVSSALIYSLSLRRPNQSSGKRKGVIPVPTIKKTDAEWKKQLSPNAFEVTRHAATEPPFTGENLNVHDKGVFHCICCGAPLFSSDTKFDSGTGWPSFWAPVDNKNV